jgi:hypothetical protein
MDCIASIVEPHEIEEHPKLRADEAGSQHRVKENAVVAVSLRPNYHVTFYQSGDDGRRTLRGNVVVITIVIAGEPNFSSAPSMFL